MSGYQADIFKILKAAGITCSKGDAAEVEDIMRHTIFHSTLDWQSREQFEQGAKEGWEVLVACREEDPDYTSI